MQNRREVFKLAALAAGAYLLRGIPLAHAGDADLPLVEPGKGMAASLNYANSNADVKDAKLKTDRSGVPFAKQICSGCALYVAAGKKGKDEVGKCALFQGQLVKAGAWCQSWAKKA